MAKNQSSQAEQSPLQMEQPQNLSAVGVTQNVPSDNGSLTNSSSVIIYKDGQKELMEKLDKVEEIKKIGNDNYRVKQYDMAIVAYFQALNMVEEIGQDIGQQDRVHINVKTCVMNCNIGYCYFAKAQYQKSEWFLSKAITINDKHVKAIYKRALARYHLCKYSDAFTDIKSALKIDQNNEEIKSAYREIEQKYLEEKERVTSKEKQIYQKMFKKNQSELGSSRRSSKTVEKFGRDSQKVENIQLNNTKTKNSWFKSRNFKTVAFLVGVAAVVAVKVYHKMKK